MSALVLFAFFEYIPTDTIDGEFNKLVDGSIAWMERLADWAGTF